MSLFIIEHNTTTYKFEERLVDFELYQYESDNIILFGFYIQFNSGGSSAHKAVFFCKI